MSPYVPVSSGSSGPRLPVGEWIESSTCGPVYWYLLGLFFVSLAVLPVAGAIVVFLMVVDLLGLISHSLFALFLISAFLSLPFLYVFLKRNFFYRSVVVRVSAEKINSDLDDLRIKLLLNGCAPSFMEEHTDSRMFRESRYFSDSFSLRVYVEKEGDYATIGLRTYRKEDDSLLKCLVNGISEELGISAEVIPIKELMKRRLMELKGLID